MPNELAVSVRILSTNEVGYLIGSSSGPTLNVVVEGKIRVVEITDLIILGESRDLLLG
jgi:hypothetical protein